MPQITGSYLGLMELLLRSIKTDFSALGGGGSTDHVVTTADIVMRSANDYIDYRMDSDIYAGYPHTNLQAFLLG